MKRCSWVTCENSGGRLCGACGKVAYCSDSCQKLDWKKGGHKAICARKKSDNYDDLTYAALFSHVKTIDTGGMKEKPSLSVNKICLVLLEDYATRSPNEREFSHCDEASLYSSISDHYLCIISYILDLRVTSESSVIEYLGHAGRALDSAEAALSAVHILEKDSIGFRDIESRTKHNRCRYHITLSKFHKHKGNIHIIRSLSEYRIALNFCRELPNDGYLEQKANILYEAAWELNRAGEMTEAFSLLEEAYEMQCCEKGPADYNLQFTVSGFMQFYKDEGRLDKAEEFARSALDNVITHETDEEKKLSFEGCMSEDLATILRWLATDDDSRIVEFACGRSKESLLDEAESLLLRSVAIFSGGCGISPNEGNCMQSVAILTDLLIDRQKFTPSLGVLLQSEIKLAREANDAELLSVALSKMCRYWVELVSPDHEEDADADADGADAGNEDNIGVGPTATLSKNEYKKMIRDIKHTAEEGYQLRKRLGYGQDDKHIKVLGTLLKEMKT
jgi:tetratricopeptide (TPR) repeat protein